MSPSLANGHCEVVMLAELARAIPWLKHALSLPADHWNSIFVNDEEPHVERVWLQMAPHARVSLHRIHRCRAKPLIHGHTRPAAFLILDGIYRTGVGYSDVPGGIPDEMKVHQRRPGDRFAMADARERHWVNPETPTCLTIMVTGASFVPIVAERTITKPLHQLDPAAKLQLLRDIRQHVARIP